MLKIVRNRSLPRLAATAILLGGLISLGGVSAAHADSLALGGNFVTITGTVFGNANQSEGGGSINTSYLNGKQLPFVFCVDIRDNVGVPATYKQTTVRTDGFAMHDGTIQKIHNADKIAFLLDTYGAAATTADQQGALQGAIWHLAYLKDGASPSEITGADGASGYDLTDNATRMTDYTADLLAASTHTAPVSDALWLSPSDHGEIEQGLVTAVPEPAYYQMTAFVALGGVSLLRLRRKNTA